MLPAAVHVTWVVTAFAPYEAKLVYDGRKWPALVPPASLTGSATVSPVPVPGHPHQTRKRQESGQIGVPKTVTATVLSGRKTA